VRYFNFQFSIYLFPGVYARPWRSNFSGETRNNNASACCVGFVVASQFSRFGLSRFRRILHNVASRRECWTRKRTVNFSFQPFRVHGLLQFIKLSCVESQIGFPSNHFSSMRVYTDCHDQTQRPDPRIPHLLSSPITEEVIWRRGRQYYSLSRFLFKILDGENDQRWTNLEGTLSCLNHQT